MSRIFEGLVGFTLFLTFTVVGCRPPDLAAPATPATVGQKAKALGMDPEASADLETANREFYENRPTETLFAKVVRASRHSSVATRSEAFTTFATLRGTSFHGKGLREIERMRADIAPEIKDRYAWVSWLAENPDWRTICRAALTSGSPEARRLAGRALEMGPRKPKRAVYSQRATK